MRRNLGIYILSLIVALPSIWLAVTTPVFQGGPGLALFIGAVFTAAVLLWLAWRAHRTGAVLANRCRTCDHSMALSQPGELRPPAGTDGGAGRRFWRCRHCGRLA